MLNFHDRGDELTVTAQISPAQLPDLAAAGMRSIVCHRPDSEDGAVASQAMAHAAADLGLAFAYQPVEFSRIGPDDGARFAELLDHLPKPILAYCRTGRRSAALWVMARAPRMGIDAALAASAAAGCELEELRPRLTTATPPGGGLAAKATPE